MAEETTTQTPEQLNVLFESKLGNEIYEPWRDYYLNYIKLKKLLKEEVIIKNAWTEKDEQNFVGALDLDLEKVYTFQVNTYDDLNEKLNELQALTESTAPDFDVQKFTAKLELVLNLTQELNRFQRVNYTGFTKIVKKHDRLHPSYSVKPLLNVRLKSLPFHSEDYSPLVFKISALFQFLRDNYDVDQSLSKLSSFNDETVEDYQSFKFWVHPDNLMEVKANILRHLPVLVYNSKNYYDDDDDDDDDDDEVSRFSKNDPQINCLYFDSPNFDLYNNKLTKSVNASTLRIKWVGPLYKKPEVLIEKKTFEKSSETYDVDEKFILKEKYLDSFVNGSFNATKYLNKLKKKGKSPEEIDDARKHIESFTKYIEENHVQPCLRTTYKRTAFQIPGDDKVRVVIDSDIYFIREDAFDAQRPIRDPSKWHRTDIDSKVNNPLSLLRKGEFVKFPYAELEVKVRTKRKGKKVIWIEDLVQSHLVKEIPHFSKFIHGIGSLFLEDDKLDNIPLWFNELEADMTFDPERAFLDTREKMAKLQNDEDNLKKFKTMLANSASPNLAPRSKSFSGSELILDTQRKPSHTNNLQPVQETNTEDPVTSGVDLDQSSDEDFEDEAQRGFKRKLFNIPSTFSKLLDADSEEEEFDLPTGVAKPDSYIKNAGPLKVEPKVWLANERTFNRWLHVTTLLSTLTFIIYSSAKKANSTQLAERLSYVYFALTLFSGFWGYHIFLKRRSIIMERSDKHLDNIVGPVLVAFGLMFGLIVNFVYGFRSVASQQASGFTIMGLTEDFYARNPMQKTILDFVFKLVGA
ncbi:SPX-domain-containing protein [Metschnikowia bicuspidata var. bicuspidata NRRL YB-4993]|uniref:SPX-domain-containing protein n=1 Tax=Metschnikowia bicuspidata var. bicuspidata NRRL YB-4993 TaxID=869754 RepID=A0A1A0HCZ9_9ASCO|nr:SPX-domain-containing protein [Metschnikowia bicuspidata var. bicuspidata NRRL YB-4993]OBA21813.1 SPX-domain-containing protein [Metschnikowia bicuspidata var. bicuspidata NRRL YB-4993]